MRKVGDAFEQRACTQLERAGLTLLDRNYNTRHGELDLVMRDRQTIVFVEVRYRVSAGHGNAAATITMSKQTKLIQTAQLWLAAHPRFAQHACRFDVVSYNGPVDSASMDWIRGAFETA